VTFDRVNKILQSAKAAAFPPRGENATDKLRRLKAHQAVCEHETCEERETTELADEIKRVQDEIEAAKQESDPLEIEEKLIEVFLVGPNEFNGSAFGEVVASSNGEERLQTNFWKDVGLKPCLGGEMMAKDGQMFMKEDRKWVPCDTFGNKNNTRGGDNRVGAESACTNVERINNDIVVIKSGLMDSVFEATGAAQPSTDKPWIVALRIPNRYFHLENLKSLETFWLSCAAFLSIAFFLEVCRLVLRLRREHIKWKIQTMRVYVWGGSRTMRVACIKIEGLLASMGVALLIFMVIATCKIF